MILLLSLGISYEYPFDDWAKFSVNGQTMVKNKNPLENS
jgi:hypothetical protein